MLAISNEENKELESVKNITRYIQMQNNLSKTKCVIISAMITRLEHWFSLHPEGFAKHCEPRQDQKNLDGLSWAEELQISRYKFKKYFGSISVHYKSVYEYLQAIDKFQGKPYCSVYDESNGHRTFYYRNHELLDSIINSDEQDLGLRP